MLLILLIPTQAVSEVQMGAMSSSVMSNPAYEVEEQSGQANPVHECGMKSAAELEDELAASKREHAKYTAARIAAELEKAQAVHAAGAEKMQAAHAAGAEKVQAAHAAELKKVAAELEQAVAELARLKKDE